MTKEVQQSVEGLGFKDFVIAATRGDFVFHDLIYGQNTYEGWLREMTVLAPLRKEYLQETGQNLARGESEEDPGNFYDWLAEKKVIELTAEEQRLRIHQTIV